MTSFALSGLLIAISSGLMSLLMFAVGRERIHRLWAFFCISVCIWGIGAFFVGSTQNVHLAEFWWRFAHIGIPFIPALFVHFVYTFLNLKRPYIIFGIYLAALFFSVLAVYSDLIIVNMRFVFNEFYYDSPPGLLYPFLTLYFFGLTIFSHYMLYKRYRMQPRNGQERLEKQRISYFFLATAVGFTGGSMSFFPVYGIDLYPLGNFSVVLYPLIMGYAILRYNLFDIKVVTAQIITLLIFVFTFINLLSSRSTFEYLLNGSIVFIALALGTFLIRSVMHEVEQRELIERQEHALEIANRQQESLLHFISHEIKGYLTKSEAGFSAIADGDYGGVPPELKGMATAALGEVRKGVATVMDILDASNLKKGTIAFSKKQFDLRKAVDTVVLDLRAAAEQKGLHLEFIAAPMPLMAEGDEEKLVRHVIRNLIDNAIKYTPQGSVKASLARENHKVRFVVEDTGVGITEEDKARLFTEGGRGKDSLKFNAHSTGYGLYIAKQIVEAHGGTIWAESEGEGKGSRFVAELPLA